MIAEAKFDVGTLGINALSNVSLPESHASPNSSRTRADRRRSPVSAAPPPHSLALRAPSPLARAPAPALHLSFARRSNHRPVPFPFPHPQVWNIVTGPGAILALWAMERHGLRWSLLVGSSTQLLGCLGSWAACVTPDISPKTAYGILYASQFLGALGQPLVLNNIARVAGDWRAATPYPPAAASARPVSLPVCPSSCQPGPPREETPHSPAQPRPPGSRPTSATWP